MTQTTHKMTMQEAFDKAAEGVVKQGRPSVSDGACAYVSEGPDGSERHCGVGHILPSNSICEQLDTLRSPIEELNDETYETAFRGTGIEHLPREFLEALQGCHDNAYSERKSEKGSFIELFKVKMITVAEAWDLVPTPCILNEA